MFKECFTIIVIDQAKSVDRAIRERQGAKIKQYRRTILRESQEVFAARFGVTKAAVSDWERGASTPRPHLQVAIAKELNAPWSVLFSPEAVA